jgi:hypothetical protein
MQLMSIKFPCPRCKKAIRVPDTLGGKKAKCPYCSAAVNVPGGAVKVAAATAKADPRAEFSSLNKPIESPTAGGKPYRRERGNPVMKLMILTIFIFLVAGGGFAYWKYGEKLGLRSATPTEVAKESTDTKPKETATRDTGSTQPDNTTKPKETGPPPLTDSHLFPDGTVGIALFNVETVLNSKLYDKAKDEATKLDQNPEKLFDSVLKPIVGLQLTAISRAVFAAGTGDDSLFIIRPRNPITVDDIKINKKGDYKEVKVGRFTVYEGAGDAYCVAEDRLLVVGPAALVKKVLERNKPVDLKPELDAAYKLLNPAKALGLALLPQDEVLKNIPGGGIPKMPEFEPVTQAKAVVIQVDVTAGLEISGTLQCKDAEGATALKKTTDGWVAMAKMKIDEVKKDKQGMPEEKLAEKAEELVNQLKIAAQGPNFTVTLALSEALITQLIDLAKEFRKGAAGNQANQ